MWTSVSSENGSVKGYNVILLDNDNNHVHAFIYPNIWNGFKTPVIEGGVYVFDQFSVKDVIGDLFAEASKYQPQQQPEFAIVSKFLQHEDIDIDIALSRLEELINFFNEFRETGYDSCKKEAKELALELDVEPVFSEKRKIHRLVHFDDLGVTADDDQNLSAEQKFRRYYFVYIVDQGAFQLKERFKQFQDYKEKFGFLFNLKKHLSGDDEGLKSCCMKFEGFLRHDMRYDIVGGELFNELLVTPPNPGSEDLVVTIKLQSKLTC
ncbi:hypothetical protein AgCh_022557 [Apium graveolens]